MNVKLFLLFFLACYAFNPSSYTNHTSLSSSYDLYWTIKGDTIFFALEVQTTGWIGFGLAEPTSGSMPGADIVTGFVLNGAAQIQDRYSTAFALPSIDDCQNWILINGEQENGTTVLELSRKLVTGDSQDRPFTGNDKVIWAYGQSTTISYHGATRQATVVQFFGPGSNHPTAPPYPYVDFRVSNFSIPATPTTYYNARFYNISPSLDADVHVVVFTPLIDPNTQNIIHHFVLNGCLTNAQLSASCQFIWGWAPGGTGYWLPPQAGIRVGPTGIQSLILQIHYNNPSSLSGLVDNSGVRLYYTPQLRQYDAATLQLGDAAVSQPNPIPQGTGLASYEYSCPGECTSTFPGPLTVFGDALHMHMIGHQIWGTHWRGDQYLGETNRIDFWDFAFQGQKQVNFTIMPGDRINTHCIYQERSDRPTVFGQASTDEMCIQYLFYYPKIVEGDLCSFYYNKPQQRNFTLCKRTLLRVNNSSINNSSYPINPAQVDPPGGDVIAFGQENGPAFVCLAENTESSSSSISFQSYYQTAILAISLIIGVAACFLVISLIEIYVLDRRNKKKHANINYYQLS